VAQGAVRVEGLSGLLRAFAAADKTLRDDLKDALQEAAAPVRRAAQSKAVSLGAGTDWSRMRVGAYSSVVYVAPVERGVQGRGNQRKRRPKFGTRLMDRAMQPALEQNKAEVERRLDGLIDEVANVWERTPRG
jgi:hypothetical protein